jgi:rubrerythrin
MAECQWRTCECCGRNFPKSKSYESSACSTCRPMLESGMLPDQVCEALIERAKDMVKIARLLKMAEQHRAERELFAAEHLGTTYIEDQMRALRAGYKEIRNAKGDLESWRCSSCGYKILIKRCIACELEIARS